MTQMATGDDWDKHWSEMHGAAQLNPAQDFRRKLLIGYLQNVFGRSNQSMRLLDIGCGTGDFARCFLHAFPRAEYLGLDVSATGIEICRHKIPAASFEQQDLLCPTAIPSQYQHWATVAICSEVLEHVDCPELILNNIKPYLTDSALLMVTVPGGPMSAFDKHIGHRQHFSNPGLKALLEKSGYSVREVWGAGFPFFNLYRIVVIARGKKLVDDAAHASGQMSVASQVVMSLFGVLFRWNLKRSQAGWQRFAVALPETTSTHGLSLETSDLSELNSPTSDTDTQIQ